MLKNNIPAKTEHVLYYRLVSGVQDPRYLFLWARWDNHNDDKLVWWCDERDFRKLAILYLWTWFVQDVVKATWWRIFRRGL